MAIAVYCALKSPSDFRQGVILAVNHDGDGDSTGSICGNILGAYLGRSALPQDWLAKLELREVIAEVGQDLLTAIVTMKNGGQISWLVKYSCCGYMPYITFSPGPYLSMGRFLIIYLNR